MRAIQRARTVTYVENAICHSLPLLATFDPSQCVFGPKVANWPSEERGENLAACHCLKIVSAQMATNSGNSGKGGNSGNVTENRPFATVVTIRRKSVRAGSPSRAGLAVVRR